MRDGVAQAFNDEQPSASDPAIASWKPLRHTAHSLTHALTHHAQTDAYTRDYVRSSEKKKKKKTRERNCDKSCRVESPCPALCQLFHPLLKAAGSSAVVFNSSVRT